MSIKIHAGAAGTFKTSGAVMDDFRKWAKAGRTIVTNVRGLTQEHIDKVRPDWGCTVVFVDTETADGRERLARWYQWVPFGAFILIDEAQRIFRKEWSTRDLQALDVGYQSEGDDRGKEAPQDWFDAWDRHRHFNWDIVLTTPNIKRIRPEIIECTEMVYSHRNLGLFGSVPGFKGSYVEAMHAADSSARQAIMVNRKKVTSDVWELYDSTATGEVLDTSAGQNLFKSSKLLFLLAVMVVAFVLVGRNAGSDDRLLFRHRADVEVVKHENPTIAARAVPRGAAPGALPGPAVAVRAGVQSSDELEPLRGQDLDVVAALFSESGKRWSYLFRVEKEGASYLITSSELIGMKYEVSPIARCAVRVSWQGSPRVVTCGDRAAAKGGITLGGA